MRRVFVGRALKYFSQMFDRIVNLRCGENKKIFNPTCLTAFLPQAVYPVSVTSMIHRTVSWPQFS